MKNKQAYKLAIDALTLQQKRYYPGKVEFERSNHLFDWAVRDAREWEKLEAARNKMIQLMHEQEQESRQGSMFEQTWEVTVPGNLEPGETVELSNLIGDEG